MIRLNIENLIMSLNPNKSIVIKNMKNADFKALDISRKPKLLPLYSVSTLPIISVGASTVSRGVILISTNDTINKHALARGRLYNKKV